MPDRASARAVIDAVVAAYNSKDRAAVAELYRPDARSWSPLGDTQEGRDRIVGHISELFDALPDEQMRAQVVITDGTAVVAEFESTGTRADGSPYRIEFTEVFELDAVGRIASAKTYLDPEVVADIAS